MACATSDPAEIPLLDGPGSDGRSVETSRYAEAALGGRFCRTLMRNRLDCGNPHGISAA